MNLKKLKDYIRELLLKELDLEEASVTGNVAGFDGKFGFVNRGFGKKKKGIYGRKTTHEGGHKNPEVLGYTLVESLQLVKQTITKLKKEDVPAFEKHFNASLEKFNIKSPTELSSDPEKQSFYDYVERNWKSTSESYIVTGKTYTKGKWGITNRGTTSWVKNQNQDKNKGRSVVNISKPMDKNKAEKLAAKIKDQMKIATLANKVFSDIKVIKEAVISEVISSDKIYFEKNKNMLQLWSAYLQGSGQTFQFGSTRSYMTDKSGDNNFNSSTGDLVKNIRSQYKTILKAQKSTLHKIPVYDYSRPEPGSTGDGKYDIHDGPIKPKTYHYIVASSGSINVITHFKSKSEAQGWMRSMKEITNVEIQRDKKKRQSEGVKSSTAKIKYDPSGKSKLAVGTKVKDSKGNVFIIKKHEKYGYKVRLSSKSGGGGDDIIFYTNIDSYSMVNEVRNMGDLQSVGDFKVSGEKTKQVFLAALKKYGIKNPKDLGKASTDTKKKIFNWIDSQIRAKNEAQDPQKKQINTNTINLLKSKIKAENDADKKRSYIDRLKNLQANMKETAAGFEGSLGGSPTIKKKKRVKEDVDSAIRDFQLNINAAETSLEMAKVFQQAKKLLSTSKYKELISVLKKTGAFEKIVGPMLRLKEAVDSAIRDFQMNINSADNKDQMKKELSLAKKSLSTFKYKELISVLKKTGAGKELSLEYLDRFSVLQAIIAAEKGRNVKFTVGNKVKTVKDLSKDEEKFVTKIMYEALNPDSVKQAINIANKGKKVEFYIGDVVKTVEELKASDVSKVTKIKYEYIEVDLKKASSSKKFKIDSNNLRQHMLEARNGAYFHLKNDETLNTKQKLGMGIRSVNEMLKEIEKIVRLHSRLKFETDFESDGYWKRAQSAMMKIENRLVRISRSIKELK